MRTAELPPHGPAGIEPDAEADEVGEWCVEPEALLRSVAQICDGLKIDYMITGSVAVAAYGEARPIANVDVVVDLTSDKVERFCQALQSQGIEARQEEVQQAATERSPLRAVHQASGMMVHFIPLSLSYFDGVRSKRRRQLPLPDNTSVWFASPEDVVLKKLVQYRSVGDEKHLRDVVGVLRLQQGTLDRIYIAQWSTTLVVAQTWRVALDREFSESRV